MSESKQPYTLLLKDALQSIPVEAETSESVSKLIRDYEEAQKSLELAKEGVSKETRVKFSQSLINKANEAKNELKAAQLSLNGANEQLSTVATQKEGFRNFPLIVDGFERTEGELNKKIEELSGQITSLQSQLEQYNQDISAGEDAEALLVEINKKTTSLEAAFLQQTNSIRKQIFTLILNDVFKTVKESLEKIQKNYAGTTDHTQQIQVLQALAQLQHQLKECAEKAGDAMEGKIDIAPLLGIVAGLIDQEKTQEQVVKIPTEKVEEKLREDTKTVYEKKSDWLAFGLKVVGVNREKLYKEWGFTNFEDYCKKELPLNQSTVYKIIKVVEFLSTEYPEIMSRHNKEGYVPDISYAALYHLLAKRNFLTERGKFDTLLEKVMKGEFSTKSLLTQMKSLLNITETKKRRKIEEKEPEEGAKFEVVEEIDEEVSFGTIPQMKAIDSLDMKSLPEEQKSPKQELVVDTEKKLLSFPVVEPKTVKMTNEEIEQAQSKIFDIIFPFKYENEKVSPEKLVAGVSGLTYAEMKILWETVGYEEGDDQRNAGRTGSTARNLYKKSPKSPYARFMKACFDLKEQEALTKEAWYKKFLSALLEVLLDDNPPVMFQRYKGAWELFGEDLFSLIDINELVKQPRYTTLLSRLAKSKNYGDQVNAQIVVALSDTEFATEQFANLTEFFLYFSKMFTINTIQDVERLFVFMEVMSNSLAVGQDHYSFYDDAETKDQNPKFPQLARSLCKLIDATMSGVRGVYLEVPQKVKEFIAYHIKNQLLETDTKAIFQGSQASPDQDVPNIQGLVAPKVLDSEIPILFPGKGKYNPSHLVIAINHYMPFIQANPDLFNEDERKLMAFSLIKSVENRVERKETYTLTWVLGRLLFSIRNNPEYQTVLQKCRSLFNSYPSTKSNYEDFVYRNIMGLNKVPGDNEDLRTLYVHHLMEVCGADQDAEKQQEWALEGLRHHFIKEGGVSQANDDSFRDALASQFTSVMGEITKHLPLVTANHPCKNFGVSKENTTVSSHIIDTLVEKMKGAQGSEIALTSTKVNTMWANIRRILSILKVCLEQEFINMSYKINNRDSLKKVVDMWRQWHSEGEEKLKFSVFLKKIANGEIPIPV